MMKIGIDIRLIGKKRTGDEAVFFNLVKNLAKIDPKNEYLLFTDREPNNDSNLRSEIKKLDLQSNFRVIPLGKRGINKFIWNFWTLPKYLRKNPINIYQTQYILPFFVPKKIKLITIIHDLSFLTFPKLIKFSDRILLNILIPWSLKRATKIITVSRFTKEEIERYYHVQPEKIVWIHNALPEDFLKNIPSETDLKKFQLKYNLPEKFILYLGTLQPRKNIPMLIEAFSRLNKPEMKLVLAGGRGYNFDKKIDKTVKKLGLKNRIIFTGFIESKDKIKIYKLATAFCFPSLYEGFGIPILEAFATDLPVVASRIPPHLEIAENSCLLFDTRRIESLVESLRKVVEDKETCNDLIRKQKEQLSKFSWETAAKKILTAYQEL